MPSSNKAAQYPIALKSSIAYLGVLLSASSLVASLAIDSKSSSENRIQTPGGHKLERQEERVAGNRETVRADSRRPIWNLAHMVNSIKELDYRLAKGANGIEVDVTFSQQGVPLYTYHGPPCDCWRHCHQEEDFNEYLRYVHEIAIEEPDGLGQNMSLLFLDLKLDYLDERSKARAGLELARSVVGNLFLDSQASRLVLAERARERSDARRASLGGRDAEVTAGEEEEVGVEAERVRTETGKPNDKLKLIVSVNHINDLQLVNNFIHFLEENNSSHLMSRIGFDVGMNDEIQSIESMWRRFGSSLNIWQGDGFTNCLSPFYNLERLTRALAKRDDPAGYPRKVYQWTIDLHDRMRDALRLGVDALMTNHPERLLTVLREPEIAHHFRLATRQDDPFRKLTQRSQARPGESARYQRSASATSAGFLGNLVDVLQSWWSYVREIPFLSLPTKLMPKVKRHRTAAREATAKSSQTEHGVHWGPSASTGAPSTAAECNCTVAANSTSTPAPTSASVALAVSEATAAASSPLSEPLDKETVGQADPAPYEGPKWYTSVLSNILVSTLKLAMPVDS